MNALLVILSFLVCSGIIFLVPAKAPAALLSAALLATIGVIIINRIESDRMFLLRLFLAAILVRLMVGTVIFFFSLQDFFGGDADTYDQKGWFMQQGWHGNKYYATLADAFVREGVGAPGMVYVIAGLYEVIGRNQLAIQFINVVLRGATAVIIFLCALHLFGHDGVA